MARKSLGVASSGTVDVPTRGEVQSLISSAVGAALPLVQVYPSADLTVSQGAIGKIFLDKVTTNTDVGLDGSGRAKFNTAGLWLIAMRLTERSAGTQAAGNRFGSVVSSSAGRFSEFGVYNATGEQRWNAIDARRFVVNETLELDLYCAQSVVVIMGSNNPKDTGITLVRLSS